MTPQKRKADTASPAEPSEKSPHKRPKSESTDNTANKRNGNAHISDESSDEYAVHSNALAEPLSRSQAAPDTKHEAVPQKELPQSWDQADAADKLLVKIKQENVKAMWSRIEQRWEQATGEKAAKGMLSDRYRRLKDIIAHPNTVGIGRKQVPPKVAEQPLETSNDMSKLPTAKVRPAGAVMSGPSDKPSDAISKRSVTAAKTSSSAVDEPLDKPSRAISRRSETTAKPSESACAASINDVAPEQDLPQSWEQANPGDQLIVKMKNNKISWAKIKVAWEKLTGESAPAGVLEDRYTRIKGFVIRPGTDGAYTHHRTPQTPRKPKAQGKHTEVSLDESSDESSVESSDGVSKHSIHSIPMARPKPRGAVKRQMRASAFDGPSDELASNRTKASGKEPDDGKAEAESSDELDGASQHSTPVVKSAKNPRVRPAVTTKSRAHSTAETADGMVLEMRERGSTWVEITEAWNERTGFKHVPETLRKRYARIKGNSATKPKPTPQASSKRKVKAISPDEDSYDSSAKRRKSMAETSRSTEAPIKRNMDRGKRKTSVKYTESTTDEDELFDAPVEPVATAPAKRNADRSAKANRSDPEWLVTNEKSPLGYEDLHAEFSDPKTYENFTKSDWEDLRETLPPNVPNNPDGYSIPMTFFQYDPDFRRGIREFQEDLTSGRLDPKWQADAAQAMEERARGEYDAYKEDQFEAFWGQKQKLRHDVLAGESTKIKLDLLIQNEIFKAGDHFSYSRVFGRGKNGVLVEKDCRIVKVDSKTLTFAIPPGQRKYSRHMFDSGTPGSTKTDPRTIMAYGEEKPSRGVDSKPGAAQIVADAETNGDEASEASDKCDEALVIKQTTGNETRIDSNKAQEIHYALEDKTDENDAAGGMNPEGTEVEAKNTPQDNEIHESTASKEGSLKEASAQTNGGQSLTPALQEDVLHSTSGLQSLENKVIDIDGRFNSKDVRTTNSWRSFRGIRNNQDLGSLFEMREEFYVYKHPQIVKDAKKKR